MSEYSGETDRQLQIMALEHEVEQYKILRSQSIKVADNASDKILKLIGLIEKRKVGLC